MIENIIFDLGGVLYDIDPLLTTEALARCGFTLLPGEFDSTDRSSAIDRYERGLMSTAEFIEMIQDRANQAASFEDIKQACCALMLGFTQQRIDYLQHLRSHYRLFLLSNTNAMHIELVNRQLRDTYSLDGLSALFIQPYLSYDMGLRKPEQQIYRQVVSEQSLPVANTLFVDDTWVNVESARDCGLQVLHKPRDRELCAVLPGILSCPA